MIRLLKVLKCLLVGHAVEIGADVSRCARCQMAWKRPTVDPIRIATTLRRSGWPDADIFGIVFKGTPPAEVARYLHELRAVTPEPHLLDAFEKGYMAGLVAPR